MVVTFEKQMEIKQKELETVLCRKLQPRDIKVLRDIGGLFYNCPLYFVNTVAVDRINQLLASDSN